MREQQFEIFLSNERTIKSHKAVASRIAKGKKAEAILGLDLDTIVANDDTMYESLVELGKHDSPEHAPLQNAVRKYYKFTHERQFPRLKDYHSPKHP